jgi:hypothetical protein
VKSFSQKHSAQEKGRLRKDNLQTPCKEGRPLKEPGTWLNALIMGAAMRIARDRSGHAQVW